MKNTPGITESSWVKASKTLYFTNVSSNGFKYLESQVEQCPGFLPPMRQAKGGAIAFADFQEVQQATSAMYTIMGSKVCGNGGGIRVSYDKDDTEAVRREKEEKRAEQDAHRSCNRYFCKICGAFVVKLSKALEKMKQRSTDGSSVIDEQKHIVELSACKGEVKRIQRDKGVEQQCRLNCEQCGAVVAYRPVPVGVDNKFTYLLKDSVQSRALCANGQDEQEAAGRGGCLVPAHEVARREQAEEGRDCEQTSGQGAGYQLPGLLTASLTNEQAGGGNAKVPSSLQQAKVEEREGRIKELESQDKKRGSSPDGCPSAKKSSQRMVPEGTVSCVL